MNSAALNDLALLAIGLGLGLALSLVAVMVAALLYVAYRQREQSRQAQLQITQLLQSSTQAIDKLRGEVGLSLSRMDAERLYEASLAIQRASRSLSSQVGALNKAVFAQSSLGPGLDVSNGGYGQSLPEQFTMEDEAADDERMLREANRWNGGPSVSPAAVPDPLASLTDEEKSHRVQRFFEQRRQQVRTATGIRSISDTPPAAGAGAYRSLLEEAEEVAGPSPQPPTLPDFLPDEEAAELTGKGELQ